MKWNFADLHNRRNPSLTLTLLPGRRDIPPEDLADAGGLETTAPGPSSGSSSASRFIPFFVIIVQYNLQIFTEIDTCPF